MVLMDGPSFRRNFELDELTDSESKIKKPVSKRTEREKDKYCFFSTLNRNQFKGTKNAVCYGCGAKQEDDCRIGGEYRSLN